RGGACRSVRARGRGRDREVAGEQPPSPGHARGRAGRAPQVQAERARQAVRAGHQRAHARPDEPVPLRGTRHLPADDRARGARRSQEGDDRGGAQCPPGQPHAGRAGRCPRRRHRRRPQAQHHRPHGSRRLAVLPDAVAGQPPAQQPAARQGRQPDPGRGAGAARPACAARGGAGVQGHQHAGQGPGAGPGDRGLPQRQDAGRPGADVLRRHGAAAGLLDQARQDRGELAERAPHLLPGDRPGGAQPDDQPVRVLRGTGRAQPLRTRDRNPRQDSRPQDAEGLRPPEERRLGRDHPQSRAELRDEPADGPGGRLRHPHRHGGHRQDAAGAGRGPDAGAGRPALHRDHHDPRHRERGRGHRLPARHGRREDGSVDGRTGRQPRGAGQDRRQRRRMGPRGHQRADPQPHQDQEHELHARAHVPEQVRDHRRGAEPHAQADEDADHARRPRHQDHLHGQPGADRHALPDRGLLGPDLRGRQVQGLAAQRPHHAGTRRTLAAGRLRQRGAV
ncbi:MAG: Predicted ATPase related to phosphate starvation-inducible protein PhoH, partial [uncultured Ramlibacter sp.]